MCGIRQAESEALEPQTLASNARLLGSTEARYDWNVEIRRFVVGGALLSMGPEAEPAVPALIDALRDGDSEIRRYAALVLGAIGPRARQAVPALKAALNDDDESVRLAAARALKDIQRRLTDKMEMLVAIVDVSLVSGRWQGMTSAGDGNKW